MNIKPKVLSAYRYYILTVFWDLTKGFDTVPHVSLLNVLQNCGIHGIAFKLFTSYLIDQIQYVKVNECLSDLQEVKIGVPQGTALGPILFILYINFYFILN